MENSLAVRLKNANIHLPEDQAFPHLEVLTCSVRVCARKHAKLLQLCPTLHDPVDCSPPGSSVHGILRTRRLEWVGMPSSRGCSQPRDQTHVSCVSCLGRWILHLSCQGSPLPLNSLPLVIRDVFFLLVQGRYLSRGRFTSWF